MFNIVRIIVGLGLITLGRKLFWLFVAAIGFEFGFFLTERVLSPQPEAIAFIIAVIVGIAGALIAIFLQKLAVYVGGFLAGGSILVYLLEVLGIHTGPRADLFLLLIFVIGGVIGAILVMLIFDWALIVLSSLAGAVLIARVVFPAAPVVATIVFLILVIVGIVIQALTMQGEKT